MSLQGKKLPLNLEQLRDPSPLPRGSRVLCAPGTMHLQLSQSLPLLACSRKEGRMWQTHTNGREGTVKGQLQDTILAHQGVTSS